MHSHTSWLHQSHQSSAAKTKSNTIRSPEAAQAWPWPQMETTHHCISVQPSVLSATLACLALNAFVRISVYTTVSTCLPPSL